MEGLEGSLASKEQWSLRNQETKERGGEVISTFYIISQYCIPLKKGGNNLAYLTQADFFFFTERKVILIKVISLNIKCST